MDAEEKSDIVEVKTYRDGNGREVLEHIHVFAKNTPNFYRGNVMIRVSQMVNGQPSASQPLPYNFGLPEAKSLKHAFATFDDVGREAVKKMNEEAKMRAAANSIVPASTIPTPKLTLR